MEKDAYSRIPILYSMAFHSMSTSKDDPNNCAKEFLEYLIRNGCTANKEISNSVNTKIVKIQQDKTRRELMQACNLELSIQAAQELFPGLFKSKEKNREEIQEILTEASSQKATEP